MRLVLSAVCLLSIAACSGASSRITPTPQPARDPLDVVAEAPLRLEELPGGWQRTPPGQDLGALTDLSPGCDIFEPSVPFPGALATASSSSYLGTRDQQVQTFAAIYTTQPEAETAIGATRGVVDRCGDEFKDVLRLAAEDQLEALGISPGLFASINVQLEERQPPPIGESAAAYRVQVSVSALGTSESFTVDYVAFQSGRLVAAFLHATFGAVDAGEQAAIAEALRDSAIAATSS